MHWSFCQKKMQKLSMRILLAHHSCSKWQKIAPYICSCTWLGPSNREAMNNSHMHQESSLLCNQNLTLIEYWFHGIQLQWSCRCRLFRICNSVVACSSMLYRTAGSKRREREKLKKSLLSFRNTKLPDTLKKITPFFPSNLGLLWIIPSKFLKHLSHPNLRFFSIFGSWCRCGANHTSRQVSMALHPGAICIYIYSQSPFQLW